MRSANKHFEVGEKLLILQPATTASKLFSKWCGPATIVAIRSPYSYQVDYNGVVCHYHANHLRKYHVRVNSVIYDASEYRFDHDNSEFEPDSDVNVNNIVAHVCATTAVVYENGDDFGYIKSVPLSLHRQTCPESPSKMIDPSSIQHLGPDQQAELLSLLDKYADCFSEGPGFSNVVNHFILLMESFKPKRLSAYRVSEKLKPEVNRQIQEMLANGIIRPSESPMSSPLVCVLKGKSGWDGIRLAVNYRYVNKFTHNDAHPMPDLQSIFQSVSKSKFISLCDCGAAYWQLETKESNRWLTAFVCDMGLFEFNRVPYGLKNSGSSFVRAITQILSPIHDLAKSFVDDVAVHSNSWRAQVGDLEQFLKTILWSGLTLNLKKCGWARNQVRFCGKVVGSGKIFADPDKLAVMDKMCPPKTKTELKRLLGFFGFFRDHIRNYAEVSKPLTELTFKRFRTNIPWETSQQKAFERLKGLVKEATEEPLHLVDFDKPFYLFVDASQHTVSSAMTQIGDGKHLPIAFSSTKLNDTQKKWAIIEKKRLRYWLHFESIDTGYFVVSQWFIVTTTLCPI